MWPTSDVFEYAVSIIAGKSFDICLIDFSRLSSIPSYPIRQNYGNIRDQFIRRFPRLSEVSPNKKHRRCRWTVELFHSQIIDQVIDFNHNLKSMPERHQVIFVCLDNSIRPDEEAALKCSYPDSQLFQFDPTIKNQNYGKLFEYLQRRNLKRIVPNKLNNFYPLLLHTNSNSTGLVFNYYYSYLNKQIGSTNNIFIKLIFNQNLPSQLFPSKISVQLNTLIEQSFLTNSPTTIESNNLKSIQSKILLFYFDLTKSKFVNQNETIVSYSLIGVNDFGSIIKTIRIYEQNLPLNHLRSIEINDDIRQWNQEYQNLMILQNDDGEITSFLENRDDPRRKCYFLPIDRIPNLPNGHNGVSTMKKTTLDCYKSYIDDHKNGSTEDGRRICQILVVPVYYILLPSSCQFGPSDIAECCSPDPLILRGTIIDSIIPDRIRLAYVNREVLRSNPMKEYNRYIRRTFYYVDHINENDEVIRYLFCGEYPNILSTLNQLEKLGEISPIEKHDEYLRFCNMLHQLVQINHISESIKLIQFNDHIDQQDADFKPMWEQIKEDIDQYYRTPDHSIFDLSIDSKILHRDETSHVLLFFTEQAKEDPLIVTLIKNISEQLRMNDLIVEDAQGNFNLIEGEKRILFICTGRKNEKINRSIINLIQKKIERFGVLRDVFILINEAIQHFPCRFIRSIPYLTFDLGKRSPHLDPNEIEEMIFYLKNMNIFSQSYEVNFEDINSILIKSPLQCTGIGKGCGIAFYFNYIKLILSSSDHYHRVKSIENQIRKEELIDENCQLISKWIFLIPSNIRNTNQILSRVLSINENEEKQIGLKLSTWKSRDQDFKIPDLLITIAGVFQRSYSPLMIYKLTNLISGKSFYFPMEIPAALHGLENQYNDVLSHFNFGKYDSEKQGLAFQQTVKEYLSKEQDQIVNENTLFLYLDNSQTSIDTNLNEILLQSLWKNLCSDNEN